VQPGVLKLRIIRAPRYGIGLRLHVIHRECVELSICFVAGWRKKRVRVIIDRDHRIDSLLEHSIDAGSSARFTGCRL
jgi:hypothetical protein